MRNLTLLAALLLPCLAAPPNFVVMFCDDLGYGDLACFGHPTIRTPNLDRMAHEGQKWTQFYVAANVCTPSRAGLLTGRLPIRNGMCSDTRRVLFPDSASGLSTNETTIAEVLKTQGYKTACVGKWHLGHLPEFLPTQHGFDSYFGIPYSNDMDRVAPREKGQAIFWEPKSEYWAVPLLRGTEEIERPADQTTITRRYTEEAVRFIKANRKKPFFLYLPHSLPHVPLFADKEFIGSSARGLYGDVIEEIDWSMGQVLKTLTDLKLDKNTIVVFTSDNGPWLSYNDHGGSAGLLRDGKGSTWEGGMREPTIFWGPGIVQPGVVHDLGATLDLLPTFASFAGAELPYTSLDGYNLSERLTGKGESPRDRVIYYHGEQLFAIRVGKWKAHFKTKTSYIGQREAEIHEPGLLYNLHVDPSEKYDLAEKHPEIVKRLRDAADAHIRSVVPVESRLTERIAPTE